MTASASFTRLAQVLACSLLCTGSVFALPQSSNSTPSPSQTDTTATAQTATMPPLRQADSSSTKPPTAQNDALIQQHQIALDKLKQQIHTLEQTNQQTLAENQTLQLDNDSLGVQVQVLQSERSAQMFIYGAVTFACGLIMGLVIYSFIYTRRRRAPW